MRHATFTPVLDPRGTLTQSQLAAAGFLARYSGNTLANYTAVLRPFFAWCDQHELEPLNATRAHLELWVRHCEIERRNKPATIVHKIGVIQGFYEYAAIDDLIPKSPAAHIRKPRFFTDETRKLGLAHNERLALIAESRRGTPVEEALIALLLLLGLRVGEASRVRIEHYQRDTRGHRVLEVNGKGNKLVSLPLPVPVLRSIERAAGDRTEGVLLIRDTTGTPMTRDSAHRMITRLARQAGINTRLHPHLLRNAFITSGLDAGCTLRQMQNAARHADPRTTMRYDTARTNLDTHANYLIAAYLGGAA